MTKSHIFLITVISILVVVFASCSQKPIQAPAPVEKIPPAMEGKKPSAEAWEEEWDRILYY